MMLVEETQVPDAALPVQALKDHLRLGSGFSESDLQDGVLVSFLRAAIAAVEARCSRALVERSFLLTLNAWKEVGAQPLLIGPVTGITEVLLVDVYGTPTTVNPASYRIQKDAFEPKLRAISDVLPRVPQNGSAEIRFTAGYGSTFAAVPDDLKQAVMLLAAHYYEYRDDTALSQGCMPFGVTSLVARYRPVRVGLGA